MVSPELLRRYRIFSGQMERLGTTRVKLAASWAD